MERCGVEKNTRLDLFVEIDETHGIARLRHPSKNLQEGWDRTVAWNAVLFPVHSPVTLGFGSLSSLYSDAADLTTSLKATRLGNVLIW